MLIPIKLPDDQQQEGSGLAEWSLIELNGTLNAGPNTTAIAGLGLGELTFPSVEKPVLIIGANKLEGRVVKLAKPFLIMHKCTATAGDGMDVDSCPEASQEGSEAQCPEIEYQVVGLVKQKLLFHQRPKPIVSKHHLPASKDSR